MTRTLLKFSRFLALVFLLGVISFSLPAQVPVGATKEEVIKQLGWPLNSTGNSRREILNYEECSVLLEGGKLVKLEFKSAESRQNLFQRIGKVEGTIAPEPLAEPKSVQAPTTTPETPAPKPVVAKPAEPEPPPRESWGILKISALVAIVLIVVGIMAYKSWASEKKDFVKLQRELLKKGNTQSEAPYKPTVRDPALPPRTTDPFATVSLNVLKEMEWYRFQQLVAAFERELGYDARMTEFGSDDGVDIRVYDRDPGHVTRLIECKAHGSSVKIDLVRAFHEVMVNEGVAAGTFYAPDGFSPEAMTFVAGKNLELIDGPKFIARIKLLDSRAQLRLRALATEGDYKTPTCSACGAKMRLVEDNTPTAHWVCTTAPACTNTMSLKRKEH